MAVSTQRVDQESRPVVSSAFLPFDVHLATLTTSTVFEVPDGEFYQIIQVGYVAQVAGAIAMHIVAPGGSQSNDNRAFHVSAATLESGIATTLTGLILGPGTTLQVQTGHGNANIIVSVKRHFVGT